MRQGVEIRRWRICISGLGLLVLLTISVEIWHGAHAELAPTRGRIGLTLGEVDHFGPREARVVAVVPGLPADAAGIRAGDRLRPRQRFDLWRGTRPGEAIAVQVIPVDGAAAREVSLTTVAGSHPNATSGWFSALNALVCLISIAFGLAIGWRQPDRPASIALALAFIGFGANVLPYWSPTGWLRPWQEFLFHAMLVPPWLAMLWWALHLVDSPVPSVVAALRRALPLLVAICGAATAATLPRGLGYDVPGFLLIATAWAVLAGGATLIALGARWRAARALARLRAAWLLAAFVPQVVFSWSPAVAQYFDWQIAGTLFLGMAVANLLGFAALGLAVLRHDVLDLGLAITRSVVAALAGLLLVGSFHLLQFAIHQVAGLSDPLAAALFGAALAASAYGGFRLLKPAVERLVDRWFFGRWLARRAALQAVASAPPEDSTALAESWLRAVDAFTGTPGSALYIAEADGGWALVASTWQAAPATPDADAIPMTLHGGDLRLGVAPGDVRLGADDRAALAESALQVGGRYLVARLRASAVGDGGGPRADSITRDVQACAAAIPGKSECAVRFAGS
jgi:hypothetical protein